MKTLFFAIILMLCFTAGYCSNLLTNESFTKDTSSWVFHANSGITLDTTVGHNDKNSLKVQNGLLIYQTFPVKPGAQYVYGAWIKTDNLGGNANLCLEYASKNGYLGGSYIDRKVEGTNDWKYVSFVSPPVPKGVQSAQITLYVRPYSWGTVWYDDVSVEELKAIPLQTTVKEGDLYNEPAYFDTDNSITITASRPESDESSKANPQFSIRNAILSCQIFGSVVNLNETPIARVDTMLEYGKSTTISIPANSAPLGENVIVMDLKDPKTGEVIFSNRHSIYRRSRVRFDFETPNALGIVGSKDENYNLGCLFVFRNFKNEERKTYRLKLTLTPADNTKTILDSKEIEAVSGTAKKINYSLARQPFGHYYLKASLIDSRTGQVLSEESKLVSKLNYKERPANAVDILPNGLITINGKETFPVGEYIWSLVNEIVPIDQPLISNPYKNRNYYLRCLDEIKQTPIDFIIDYGTFWGGVDSTRDVMDEAYKRNISVVLCTKDDVMDNYFGKKLPLDYKDILGGQLEQLKNHPALIGNYINDEASGEMLPYTTVQKRSRQIDPWHPTYSVHCVYKQSDNNARYTDIMGTDPYVLMGDQREAIRSFRAARQALSPGMPMWPVIGIFGDGYEHSDPNDLREPTYEELRAGVLEAVTQGATGIVYYTMNAIQRSPDFARRWQEISDITAEVKSLKDFVKLPTDTRLVTSNMGDDAAFITKGNSKSVQILVVNPMREKQKITLNLNKSFKSVSPVKTIKGKNRVYNTPSILLNSDNMSFELNALDAVLLNCALK